MELEGQADNFYNVCADFSGVVETSKKARKHIDFDSKNGVKTMFFIIQMALLIAFVMVVGVYTLTGLIEPHRGQEWRCAGLLRHPPGRIKRVLIYPYVTGVSPGQKRNPHTRERFFGFMLLRTAT
ncbi:MAG: hypothetical protein AB9835_10320 [Eubacteriales bacterium]